ncbi:holin [Streptomyces sp. WAC 06725]|uniref:holin n=1 Tax=Streptomyces sp. WAC 06725 TaxID=2203209 RepID=UPI000F736009|nr:holin [Streptomyces sp. WAC 06725]RSO26423.1 holin [Streptomyces sp. WAC 06725]
MTWQPPPVEKKVSATTLGSLGAAVAITVLNGTVGDADLMGSVPAWLQHLATLIVPPLITFLGGYTARHTPRSDPAAGRTPRLSP